MKIIAVHSSSELYGSDRSLLAICESAAKKGHEVEVLLPGDGPLVERVEQAGGHPRVMPLAILRRADLFRARSWWQFFTAMNEARRLAQRAESTAHPTVVLSNTSAVLSGTVIARKSKASHVQVVREIYSSPLESSIFDFLTRWASVRIFVSEACQRQFKARWFTRPSGVVVNSGAELAFHEWSPRSHNDSEIRVTCVGRLSAWKGQEVLIAAISVLMQRGHRVRLRIVGGEYGETDHYLDRLIEQAESSGLADMVEFIGEVTDPTPHYLWADVVAVPSQRPEPFGKVVIEAMNASRPVVATAHGGPAEVLADGLGGVLFAPHSADALADAIIRAASVPAEWEVLSHQAFTKSVRYSAAASADRIVDLLQSAAFGIKESRA